MLSENIAALRKAANETQNDLADALGISNRTVSKWENGESEPDCRTLMELARHYRTTWHAVERGIRYEICTIWEANSQMLSTLAGVPLKERPVPKQFIGILMAWLTRGAA